MTLVDSAVAIKAATQKLVQEADKVGTTYTTGRFFKTTHGVGNEGALAALDELQALVTSKDVIAGVKAIPARADGWSSVAYTHGTLVRELDSTRGLINSFDGRWASPSWEAQLVGVADWQPSFAEFGRAGAKTMDAFADHFTDSVRRAG